MSALAIIVAALFSAPGNVVARIDGTSITSEALTRRVEVSAVGMRPDRILGTMIDEALFAAEGRRLKLERSPHATTRFETLQRMQAGKVFLANEIAGKVSLDDGMLQRLFHSTADFAAFDLLTFQTSNDATAALERIKKGGSFAAEAPRATTSSVRPDPKGAPLVMRSQIYSSLATALFAAEPPAVVGPVQLAEGFAIARLLTKVTGTDAEFQNKRAALETHARSQLAEQMKSHVLAQLREQSRVKLDEAFLRSVDEVEPTQQQLEHVLASPGDRALRYDDIFENVRSIRATGGHMGAALRIAVAWRAIDARLLESVAVERGFLKAPEVVALRAEHETAAVGYAAMRRVIDAAPPPTKNEISRFYERNSAAFGRPLAEVRAQAAAGAFREKRDLAYAEAVAALRKKATISVDREALARVVRPGA